MGYTAIVIKGISWIAVLRGSTRFITFVRTAILARILSPSQFGLFGISSLVLAFIEILTETGINVFLVQTKGNIDKFINTAWIVSILRGVIIFLVILLASPLIALFFNAPSALPLLTLVSVVPLVRGFINPSIAKFQKELNFDKEFFYRFSVFLVETAFTLALVLMTKDPIALIWGLVAGALFEVGISFAFVAPRPRPNYSRELFREIIAKGKWVTSAGIFSYLFRNGGSVMVGRILGTSALGIYDMAYRISTLPITEVAEIVSRVTFPVYVKIAGDRNRLKRAYIKTTLLVGLFSLPILMVFLLFPKQIVLLILGDKWLDGVLVLQVLSVFALIHTLGSTSGAVFLSLKKQEYISVLTFIGFTVLLLTIIPLITVWRIVGAGLSTIIASISTVPFLVFFLIKVFKGKNG